METVVDRYGNEVYLTDERWQHIIEQHPEMLGHKPHLFKTVRDGKRNQHHLHLDTFVYTKRFDDLPRGMTHVYVIVKFGFKGYPGRSMTNNFVLTAYQKKIFR
ncbi:hypothetical protein HUU05_13155 [candidate division KSB1 bacterium]|nr:hypothetical protein [candidate division KSB1 bacterium]